MCWYRDQSGMCQPFVMTGLVFKHIQLHWMAHKPADYITFYSDGNDSLKIWNALAPIQSWRIPMISDGFYVKTYQQKSQTFPYFHKADNYDERCGPFSSPTQPVVGLASRYASRPCWLFKCLENTVGESGTTKCKYMITDSSDLTPCLKHGVYGNSENSSGMISES